MIKDLLTMFGLLILGTIIILWAYTKLTETGEYPEIRASSEKQK